MSYFVKNLFEIKDYRTVGDNVYRLGKLVPYGSIFISHSFTSGTSFGCLHLSGKGVAFGDQMIIFWNLSFHATISTDIYAGKTFVNLLVP